MLRNVIYVEYQIDIEEVGLLLHALDVNPKL